MPLDRRSLRIGTVLRADHQSQYVAVLMTADRTSVERPRVPGPGTPFTEQTAVSRHDVAAIDASSSSVFGPAPLFTGAPPQQAIKVAI